MNQQTLIALLTTSVVLLACTPTVKVEAPDEPITINLNVKIEHEIEALALPVVVRQVTFPVFRLSLCVGLGHFYLLWGVTQ